MTEKTYKLSKDLEFIYSVNKSTEASESSYKSHALPRSNNTEKSESVFRECYNSYEILPMKMGVLLKNIFRYLLNSDVLKLGESQLLRVSKNSRILNSILNGIEQGSFRFVEKCNQIHLMYNTSYGYTKKYNLGRLYPSRSSINQMSREFRYHLVSKIYQDVDLINAHPSILHEYAKSKQDFVELKQLVENRDAFYSKILDELGNTFRMNSVKNLVLICLNVNKPKFNSGTLNSLNKEILQVRQHLYKDFYLNDLNFKSAIDFRMIGIADTNKILLKIQSLYCFNVETDTILKFKKLLEDEWVDIDFSVIPFFDGLLVENVNLDKLCPESLIMDSQLENLDEIILNFNKKSSLKLKRKPLISEYKTISEAKFSNLSKVVKYVDSLTYGELQELLLKYNIVISSEQIMSSILSPNDSCEHVTLSFDNITAMKATSDKQYAAFLDGILADETIMGRL